MPPKGYISPSVLSKLDELYNFIERYKFNNGYPPSRDELAVKFNTSKSVIGFYLRHMVKLGLIQPPKFGISRCLTLIKR
jgi:hypothetical protein